MFLSLCLSPVIKKSKTFFYGDTIELCKKLNFFSLFCWFYTKNYTTEKQ